MSIGTVQDVETSLMRTLTETESLYVYELLDRAERLLVARIPDLLARAIADPDFSALVADIEGEAVARVFRAPDSGVYRQEAEGNYSYALNTMVASGLLDILEGDWRKLGASIWRSVAPATDGYLSTRSAGVPPQWHFQYGWGGGDQMSEEIP